MAEIPRKQVIPQHMIQRLIAKIERDVQQQIIPIQTGMYSLEKLDERLRAIPNPELVSYDDPIFYDIHEKIKESTASSSKQLKDLPPPKCPNCEKITSAKQKLFRCGFCGLWRCEDCLCERKRPHPRSKNIGMQNNEPRYSICYPCDKKFLILMLNHNFSETKRVFQQAIQRLKKQCDKIVAKEEQIKAKQYKLFIQPAVKNTSKLQKLKKQRTQLKKEIDIKNKEIGQQKSKFLLLAKDYQSLQIRQRQIQLKKSQKMKQLLIEKQRLEKRKEEKQKQQQKQKQEKALQKQQMLRKKQQQLEQQRQRIQRLQQQRYEALKQLQQQKLYRRSIQENNVSSLYNQPQKQVCIQSPQSKSNQEETLKKQQIEQGYSLNGRQTQNKADFDFDYAKQQELKQIAKSQQTQINDLELSHYSQNGLIKTEVKNQQFTEQQSRIYPENPVNVQRSSFAQNQPSNESFILNHFRQSRPVQQQLRSSFQNRQLYEYYNEVSVCKTDQEAQQGYSLNKKQNRDKEELTQMTFQPSRLRSEQSDSQDNGRSASNMYRQKETYFQNEQQEQAQLSLEQLQRRRDEQAYELQRQFREKKLQQVRESLKERSAQQMKQVHSASRKQILQSYKQKTQWGDQDQDTSRKLDSKNKCTCEIY